jgi:Sulfotransferase family
VATHDDRNRVKVLSIVGTGRSGTTVLAAILGEVGGFFDTGELHWVWSRSLVEQPPCGCGRRPAECPVWAKVIEAGLGIPPEEQATDRARDLARDITRDERAVVARRNRVRLLRTTGRPDPGWPALERIRDVYGKLYDSLVEVTGARVVVDASKRPEDAAVLAGLDSIDQYFLHIVRDPRAVVFSWSRLKASPDGTSVMRRIRLPKVVLAWLESNVTAEALSRRVPRDRWFFTTYEEFAAEPRRVVAEIVAFLGEDGAAPFVTGHSVALGVNHTLLGNPDRFRTGEVGIAPDDVWRSQMPRSRKLGVLLATLPMMLRYGYGMRPRPKTERLSG